MRYKCLSVRKSHTPWKQLFKSVWMHGATVYVVPQSVVTGLQGNTGSWMRYMCLLLKEEIHSFVYCTVHFWQ